MKVHEYQAKEIFVEHGLPVPKGKVATTVDQADTIDGHARNRYDDRNGNPVIETVMVRGMGHAMAVDPDGDPGCGATRPFFVDADICAALWIARWFGIAR